MGKDVSGSKVLLLGSGFGMQCTIYAIMIDRLNRSRESTNTGPILVAKPTVDVLDQAGVEVTVGRYLFLVCDSSIG